MTTITIEANAARYLAEALLPAVSKDDVTPVLTGAHLSIENGSLRAIATDRYRVHTVLLPLVGEAPEELDALVPRPAIEWLVKSSIAYLRRRSSAYKSVVVFEFTYNRAVIRVRQDATADLDEQTISTELIKGNFPPVIKLVEKARTAETTDAAEAILRLDFLASMRHLDSGVPPVLRFTKGDNRTEGPVLVTFGPNAEALIQPNRR